MVPLEVHVYTGHSVLDAIIERSTSILLYGPAATGKTTLLMTIAGNICRHELCVYVSTEETLHYERVARAPERYERALFAEAYDMNTLVKAALVINALKPKYVFVDSINSLYRAELDLDKAMTKLGLVTSLLLRTVELSRGKLFASAQVRVGESGDVEASGYKILDYYFDFVASLFFEKNDQRVLRIVKTPPELSSIEVSEFPFRITSEGVIWIERAT